MECAIFAMAGVILGAVLALAARADLSGLLRMHRRRHNPEKAELLPAGQAKTEEELMQQWENLLRYSGGNEEEARG